MGGRGATCIILPPSGNKPIYNNMDTKVRLTKAIDFFRKFSDKADTNLYKRSVLKFCDLVEQFLESAPEKESTYEKAQKVFDES